MTEDIDEMTAAELVELHDRLCEPGDRIGRPWRRAKAELADRVRALRGTGATTDATVSALVRRLLIEGGLAYAEVADRARQAFPGASTTARSVASVAAAMRRRGVHVPLRRRPSAT